MDKHDKMNLMAVFREAQMIEQDIMQVLADEAADVQIEVEQIIRRLKRAAEQMQLVKKPKFGG